ncbi:MAG: hypothetical protein A3F94_00895 [Candidatus Spechtbacteria bacterium RIFCSPLOWO2_12_FULL_38_22]|uniref:Uncharacterized protein n=1 Tax=Candidatus Spechtbacteria bacterium RIFCSPLOWO2_12_FULL_38_22 TaxID=1802165 RepID=A0A1G2HGW9_9BACT|nr:MAG: hypothetical protein A2728_01790 [Candidatus Spechtbacteria bacterium RIFCSPHIGHO2_01_FULL_38_11]OGZ59483.1 MAG: hypothetical protein A3E58_00880 [Candidatus Spechtbacteria bacterium RIFCSPHIGHO2_12_FULL_38_30]OGZ61737.1 MAG: hypothetical protein A3F94_00895 [Candidatus Spechtbacteria bacterium RIFCSPLOWO2_12_FULL_38_22]
MLKNHLYNLLLQIVQENKTLWRIKNHYLNDLENCSVCKEFWNKMEVDKKQHIQDLKTLIKQHLE